MNENPKHLLIIRQKWLLLLLLSILGTPIFAQQMYVSGVVISAEDNQPIPGASVIEKGTTNGTITDIDGKYNIKVEAGKTLVFSFVGMENTERKASGASLNVTLNPESIGLDEVVAIGYGSQKKKEISGAVVQIKSEELTQISTADIGTALQGQVAGVNVQASSGAPGAAANIQIRGISSVNGANSPLFVVDGIPQDGDPRLSNNEIETLDILKDAASCAIYGTRGAAGVILITTKQGKEGAMKVSVDSYAGIQKITSGIELMDFNDYFYNFLTFHSNVNNTHGDNTWVPMELNPNDFTNNTNIMDAVQNDNAFIQNHSVNISGGRDDLTYSVVGSYFQQDGVLINSGYERFNLRSNTNFKKGRWKFNLGLGGRIEESEHEPWNLLYDAYNYKPYQQPVDPNQDIANDAGNDTDAAALGNMMYKFQQTDITNTESMNANLNINFNIMKGLDFNTRIGASYTNSARKTVNPPIVMYDQDGEKFERAQFRSKVKDVNTRATSFTMETGLNYSKTIGDHSFKALGVFSTEQYTYSQSWGERKDLFGNGIYVLNAGTSEPNSGSGNGQWGQDRDNTIVGILARGQYSYKGKYNLSASVRRDGSSRFEKENRWGTFASVSGSWNVADEAFWANFVDIANAFKIRASYGETGNQSFADYSTYPTITPGYDYPYGPEGNGSLGMGGIQTGFSNSQVKWETTKQTNFGTDLGFLNNRLTFTADYYHSDKSDMLFPYLLPTSTGAGQNESVILNIGNMTNKGFELSAGWRQAGKFTWSVNATFTRNQNMVTNMGSDTDISYFAEGWAINQPGNNDKITAVREGYEAGAFWVMATDGIINTEQKLTEYQKIMPTARMGDLMYVDTNGDGVIDEDDRVYGGSGMPDFELGLTLNADYKGFDISMVWYASVGNDVINGSKLTAYSEGTHQDLLYQWSDTNPYGVIPAQRSKSHMNNRGWADVWVEDGSFVRLRNVTLGYTVPKSAINRIGISKLRVYLATDNPLTLTKYQGYNPEVGGNGLATRGLDRGNFPVASQYRMGIQLDF